MGNPLNIDALDARLAELLTLLRKREPYERVAAAVRQFADDYTSEEWGPNSVFREDWEDTWQSPDKVFATAWIRMADGLDGPQKDALGHVGAEAVRFLLDSETDYHERKHAAQLRNALEEYLALRGHDVSCDPEEQPAGPWSTPDSPSRWAKRFNCSLDTFNRMLEAGKIRYKKLTSKSMQIHVDDLPVD